jgi:serine/threonine-protein kinase
VDIYNIYLQGLHYSHRWSAEGLGKAVQLFEQAVAEDPNFASAWAALAETECVLAIHAGFPPREAMPKAKAHASRALELDEGLSMAHASLGLVKGVYEWDWPGAETEFRRALELDPTDPTILEASIMGFLIPTGRLDEALKLANDARRLDPVSARINSVAGLVHYFRRDYDEALGVLQKTLELEPNFYSAHLAIGSVYEEKGMFDKAVAEIGVGRAAWESGVGRSALAYTYARMGKHVEARALLNELTSISNQRYISPAYMAAIHVALGERNLAMDWLDKAYEQRSSSLAMLKVNPRFDSLRTTPRFVALVKKIGLGG